MQNNTATSHLGGELSDGLLCIMLKLIKHLYRCTHVLVHTVISHGYMQMFVSYGWFLFHIGNSPLHYQRPSNSTSINDRYMAQVLPQWSHPTKSVRQLWVRQVNYLIHDMKKGIISTLHYILCTPSKRCLQVGKTPSMVLWWVMSGQIHDAWLKKLLLVCTKVKGIKAFHVGASLLRREQGLQR